MHAKHHNILTSAQELVERSSFAHIISVRADNLACWQEKGYEVIEKSEDAYLIGKRKA